MFCDELPSFFILLEAIVFPLQIYILIPAYNAVRYVDVKLLPFICGQMRIPSGFRRATVHCSDRLNKDIFPERFSKLPDSVGLQFTLICPRKIFWGHSFRIPQEYWERSMEDILQQICIDFVFCRATIYRDKSMEVIFADWWKVK